MTREVTRKVVDAYRRFEYTTVYHSLYHYATVTLSNVYIDILKDRLYTFAPKSTGRRSAQTALYRIVDTLARLLAPILAFTADEIWESLPAKRETSVHLAEFPDSQPLEGDEALLKRWNERDGGILYLRSFVQRVLEGKRTAAVIGSSLDAKVTLELPAEQFDLLRSLTEEALLETFIVSEITLAKTEEPVLTAKVVEHADGQKCERCWHWSETVGKDPRVPGVDERCIRQLEEGWGLR
jgi:isoleucyl-tRNA synthetase